MKRYREELVAIEYLECHEEDKEQFLDSMFFIGIFAGNISSKSKHVINRIIRLFHYVYGVSVLYLKKYYFYLIHNEIELNLYLLSTNPFTETKKNNK